MKIALGTMFIWVIGLNHRGASSLSFAGLRSGSGRNNSSESESDGWDMSTTGETVVTCTTHDIDFSKEVHRLFQQLDNIYLAQGLSNRGIVLLRRKIKKLKGTVDDLMTFSLDVIPKISKVLMQIMRMISFKQTRFPAEELSAAEEILNKYLQK